jgi:hypothetical protein
MNLGFANKFRNILTYYLLNKLREEKKTVNNEIFLANWFVRRIFYSVCVGLGKYHLNIDFSNLADF